MRYSALIRINGNDFPEGGPSEGLIDRMNQLIEEMKRAGVLLETAELTPTARTEPRY